MNDAVCPQCLIPNTIDCREDDCPGETRFVARAEAVRPDLKMLETMGARVATLETLVLAIADGTQTGAVILPLPLREVVDGEAGKIRKGGKEGAGHGC